MKSFAKLLALVAVVLLMALPASAFWGRHDVTDHGHPYRGAFMGALGGYAVSKMTHSHHTFRNSLIGAGVGAYLGHRHHERRYY